jgi:hypothetical protein
VWAVTPTPSPSGQGSYLNGVDGSAPNDVWAVGARYRTRTSTPALLVEHWNGSAWSLVKAPVADWNYNELNAVSVLSKTDAWAVGYRAGRRVVARSAAAVPDDRAVRNAVRIRERRNTEPAIRVGRRIACGQATKPA